MIELVTKNFTRAEFTVSQTAARAEIINKPLPEHWQNIEALCINVLEPARKALGPIRITSGYRSHALNKVIGGARNSQHLFGEAADILPLACSLGDLYRWIVSHGKFDQCIWEFGQWVHVSHKRGGPQRGERLLAWIKGGKTVYAEMTDEQMKLL